MGYQYGEICNFIFQFYVFILGTGTAVINIYLVLAGSTRHSRSIGLDVCGEKTACSGGT